ncbi:MAG TPA: tetratricopeptide repeat protein [Longimicrobiales bacterium]|nr:tetratricopeptide repeat protein [Longimicrobiales bacterium]
MSLSTLVARVRARKLGQWAVAYLASAWLVLQILSLLAQPFAWPDLVLRAATVLLAIGLLAVLVLAWYHGERGAQRVTGIELLMLAGILVLAGAAVTLVGKDKRAQATTTPETASPAAAPMAAQGSIAVLPFANVSPDRAQDYFVDGLTDELLNVLAGLPELRVAARTSSFAFAGQRLPADSIGRALHVATLLEGSVRKEGMRVRISADLIDAKTGFTLWRQTYDRDLKDVFQVQDEISRAIVASLRVKLGAGHAGTQLAREETRDAHAHLAVLEGLHLVSRRGRADLQRAEALFRQALQRDPGYARAYADLASVHWLEGYYRFTRPGPSYALAQEEARRALALDSTIAEAHVVLGRVADLRDWDFAGAEREFRQGIELNPGLPDAYSLRAWVLMRLGHPNEALADALHATELDPLSPTAVNTLGAMYTYSGQLATAVAVEEQAVTLAPNASALRSNRVQLLSLTGRHAEALAAADSLRRIAPGDPIALAVIAYAYARAGKHAQAEEILRALEAQPDSSPYLLAVAYAGLGDAGRAFSALDAAVRRHDDFVPDVGVDPVFAAYRSDPRIVALLKKIGLSG